MLINSVRKQLPVGYPVLNLQVGEFLKPQAHGEYYRKGIQDHCRGKKGTDLHEFSNRQGHCPELCHEKEVDGTGLQENHQADKQYRHNHVEHPSKARGNLGNIVSVEAGKAGAASHTQAGNTKGHPCYGNNGKPLHEVSGVHQDVCGNNQDFCRKEQNEKINPELAPQHRAQFQG